ncbi:hypothetical protein Tco_1034311, partial [Tanacetum coccineum]
YKELKTKKKVAAFQSNGDTCQSEVL